MFVGHYAAAFALKGREKEASLGWLFIATQFVDILFFPFVVWGLETMEFVPGYTETNDFKMEFPFTHSLIGSILWAIAFGGIFFLLFGRKKTSGKSIAFVLGLGVLSHWVADLFVHTPDLPLLHGEPKFGFGLWHNKAATFALEALVLLLGLWYYLKRTVAKNKFGKFVSIGFVLFLLLVNYLNYYVLPANHDIIGLTISALVSYFLFAGLAFWVDTKRT
ncbi:hypothetical protein [Croceivirga thetidis]|uniref:Metal-dependent hydrolase n=1 Tax=Croceivirga thetidis TaxID=2721623 RepID=A0ABX1GN26_9FLAO|nr:hypothetical protein [Croceivirga thetidis]NKI30491.1 hypothetical protein [Croceivirga thetidis]